MTTIRRITGDLDRFNVADVRDEVEAVIEGGETRLIFNLNGLKFIDSGGLSFLMDLARRLPAMGGGFAISEPSTLFRSTVSALKAEELFPVFATDEEAERFLGS